MKCDKCDKKATVFLTQFIGGSMKKVCLCEACAEEQGVTDPMGFSLADMLLGNEEKADNESVLTAADVAQCEVCNFTLEDFRKVGRLGCPSCYKAFAKELSTVLPNMHVGQSHKGKVPSGMVEIQLKREELMRLKNRLKSAIEDEDYEAAANLRDEISDLELPK